jgi:peptidoglycan/xylan/chitin deacetylase (PgdA/CDA1 family)
MMAGLRRFLSQARRKLRTRFAPRPLILVYHRVADEQIDPWRLCVSPSAFEQQLATLRQLECRIVHVSDLAQSLASNQPPGRVVAITFDDGYRDNLETARPLLQKYDAPATLFATAGYIGKDEEFWWDTLERIFLQPGPLPDVLELGIDGQRYRRELGEFADLDAADAHRWVDWRPFRDPLTIRHQMHDELWRMLVQLLPADRDEAISALLVWAGLEAQPRPSKRPLSRSELVQLRGDGLVQIGCHSLRHPALPALSPAALRHELVASKQLLEEMLDEPVRGFSYPQGTVSEDTETQVRSAGYEFACSSVNGAVPRRADVFNLPRASIYNWDAGKFRSFVENNVAA